MIRIPVHADGTIDAAPCEICGEQTLSIMTVTVTGNAALTTGLPEGEVLGEWYMCRPCKAKKVAEIGEARERFNRLVAMGATEAQADRIMTRRLLVGGL